MGNISNKLSIWVKEGLIDQNQANKIQDFEDRSPNTSWGMYGIVGIGVLVVMTGVISLIAANWEELSDFSKIISYFVTLGILSFYTFKRSSVEGLVREGLLIAYSLFLLAGIGLVGQIYNLESESWRATLFWCGLTLPLALNSKRSLLPHLWFIGLYTTLALWTFEQSEIPSHLLVTLGITYLLLGISFGFSNYIPIGFVRTCRTWAIIVVLVPGAIMANTFWANGSPSTRFYNSSSTLELIFVLVSLLISLFLINRARLSTSSDIAFKPLTFKAIYLTLCSTAALLIPPLVTPIGKHEVIGCILFLLPWCGIAIASVIEDRKRLFDLAAFVIGARFVTVYFEVFGSLAATGFGLIISGSVILFTVYIWHKYRSVLAKLIKQSV